MRETVQNILYPGKILDQVLLPLAFSGRLLAMVLHHLKTSKPVKTVNATMFAKRAKSLKRGRVSKKEASKHVFPLCKTMDTLNSRNKSATEQVGYGQKKTKTTC